MMLQNINPYSQFNRRIPSQMINLLRVKAEAQQMLVSKQLDSLSMSNTKSKAPWQSWLDHEDLPALIRNAPPDTCYEAIPLHEAIGKYADTKIFNTETQLDAFNNLKSIKGRPIKKLCAENNVLKFETGAHYRYSIGGGQSVIVSSVLSQTRSGANISWGDVAAEFATDIGVFTPGTHRAFAHIQLFLQALTTGDTWNFHQWFSPAERLELYAQVGIQPGGWVEIQNQDQTTRFYLDNNGIQWSEQHSENARWVMNNRDWRKAGATEDTVFLVNGNEYKIDNNGRLNILEGEPVIYGETVVFPKELGEYMRQKQNWYEQGAHLNRQV
jgi:hypothetical protein